MSYFSNLGTIRSQPRNTNPVYQIVEEAVPQVINEAVPQVIEEVKKTIPTQTTAPTTDHVITATTPAEVAPVTSDKDSIHKDVVKEVINTMAKEFRHMTETIAPVVSNSSNQSNLLAPPLQFPGMPSELSMATTQISNDSTSISPTVKILTSQQFSSSLENAGYDLRSSEDTVVPAGKRVLVKTDLRMQMPSYMFFKVESRSGLALKGIDAKAGVIDCSYRNFIGVILHNYSDVDFVIKTDDRVAQGVFLPVFHPNLVRLKDFSEFDRSERGENGLGSTGLQ